MLVVRRAGLAEALHDLRRRRLIKAGRGEIIVLDRAGLERLAGARARHGAAAGWSASLKT